MASFNYPLSVADIVAQAESYTYNAQIPLTAWLRTASTMQKEAQVYEAEGNDPQVYLLLYRHANLVLQKLQTHPDKNKPENRRALNSATQTVINDLRKLEKIAPRIKQRHEEFQEKRKRQQEALKALEGRNQNQGNLIAELDGLAISDEHYVSRRSYDSRPILDARASENHSLAARLAQREVKRRDAARRNVRQHGVSEEEEHQRRSGGKWDTWQDSLIQDGGNDDLSNQLQEVARLQRDGSRSSYSSSGTSSDYRHTYHYPTVPHKSAQQTWNQDNRQSFDAPSRPPKESIYRSSGLSPVPPPRPPKAPSPVMDHHFDRSRPPPVPGKYTDSAPPVPGKVINDQRPLTPSGELDEFTFKPTAFLENGDPLRPVFLPSQLRQQFLSVASSNTRLNLETCGMLCGILKSNALFVTRLVVPEQTSTSDTCETLNEEEFFDYCDKEELMVLGWIHTHPTQTCFMSSRDLHTHVGYQVMMPESVAIVCAPSKTPSWGCFRLTDPPGKQAILNCSRPGIFHPHDLDNIYTEAIKPGHVVELTNAPLEIVDLRPKKTF